MAELYFVAERLHQPLSTVLDMTVVEFVGWLAWFTKDKK